MKHMEENVSGVTMETEAVEADLPPIRSGTITLTADGVSVSFSDGYFYLLFLTFIFF